MRNLYTFAAAAAPLLGVSVAQSSCVVSLSPSSTPVAADGYRVRVIAQGLDEPRSLQFDSMGNLLVAQSSGNIVNLRLRDHGGTCVEVEEKTDLIDDPVSSSLNHGIALSSDGTKLFASSRGTVYSWDYDAEGRRVRSSEPRVVVNGLDNPGHRTRTLLYSSEGGEENLVAVRGSGGNIDLDCADKSTGHCQMKAFSMTDVPQRGYNFTTDGVLLGWGMRNSVGIAEHPGTGGIWTVENTIDNIKRNGVDIHQDNPAEELNYHGTILSSGGLNYGYPYCAVAWDVDDLPNNNNIEVGTEFAHDIGRSENKTDDFCAEMEGPILAFAPHTAPLDIKFNGSEEAFVSFHGSWNRDEPIGYRIARIPFREGEPVPSRTDTNAAITVVENADTGACPRGCFRPVGMAFDKKGRLYFASDDTGEIYVVEKASGSDPDQGEPGAPGETGRPDQPGDASLLKGGASILVSVALTLWYMI